MIRRSIIESIIKRIEKEWLKKNPEWRRNYDKKRYYKNDDRKNYLRNYMKDYREENKYWYGKELAKRKSKKYKDLTIPALYPSQL